MSQKRKGGEFALSPPLFLPRGNLRLKYPLAIYHSYYYSSFHFSLFDGELILHALNAGDSFGL